MIRRRAAAPFGVLGGEEARDRPHQQRRRPLGSRTQCRSFEADTPFESTRTDTLARVGPAWAHAAANRAEEIGLATWPILGSALLAGVVAKRPGLAAAAGVVFGRVVLPSMGEDDSSIYRELISAAPVDQAESLIRHAVVCLETDGHPGTRVRLLQEVVTAASERGMDAGSNALLRWRTEIPVPLRSRSSDDPFAELDTLEALKVVLAQTGDEKPWGAVRAFARVAPKSAYDDSRAIFQNVAVLRDDERSIEAIALAALNAGRRGAFLQHPQ